MGRSDWTGLADVLLGLGAPLVEGTDEDVKGTTEERADEETRLLAEDTLGCAEGTGLLSWVDGVNDEGVGLRGGSSEGACVGVGTNDDSVEIVDSEDDGRGMSSG